MLSDISIAKKTILRNNWFRDLHFTPRRGQQAVYDAIDAGKRYIGHFCYPRGGKSFGVAKWLGAMLLLPDVHAWVVSPCADERTEILTKRGWSSYKDLMVGEDVLTLNQQGIAEWQPCQKVNTFTGVHPMVHIKHRAHDSLTTPHHRWLVGYTTSNTKGGGPRVLGYRFTRSDQLKKNNEFIPCAVQVSNLPTEKTYPDSLVEIIGWYWTEGCNQQHGNGITISQNSGPKADRIKNALQAYYGPPSTKSEMLNTRGNHTPRWSDWKTCCDGKCGNFGINSTAGEEIRRLAPDKIISPAFISSLTLEQLHLLIHVSILADGHERIKDGKYQERVIVQKRKDRLDPLQMACQLAGLQSTLLYDRSSDRYRLQIHTRTRTWPGQHQKSQSEIEYVGVVWCPTTPNGTWLARRNGTVFFTGNTYQLGSKEFGYVWNDFVETGKLKLAEHRHFDVRGGNMMIHFPWGSFLQVISADNQTALRAEELDILVPAEASALDANIFERHLFARTERRKGIVVVPTTPKGYNWVHKSFRIPSLYPGHKDLKGQPNPAYDPAYASFVVSADPDWGDIYEPGVYDDDAIARAKRTLPPQIYKEQFCGDFASYAGLIYHFDPLVHECDPFPIPPEWTHIIGYDHGADNPTAIMFGSYGPDGTIYWWDEVYTAGLSASEYVNHIRNRMVGKSIAALMIDASAKQVRIEFAKLGLTTNTPADKQIDARIIRMTQFLRDGKMKVMRGRCPNFVEEILAWEWDEDNPGKPRPRQRCHALDAAGYGLLADVPLPGTDVVFDPDTVEGEKPEVTRLWKSLRRKVREIEERKREEEYDSTLMDDPFSEVSIRPTSYEPPWV